MLCGIRRCYIVVRVAAPTAERSGRGARLCSTTHHAPPPPLSCGASSFPWRTIRWPGSRASRIVGSILIVLKAMLLFLESKHHACARWRKIWLAVCRQLERRAWGLTEVNCDIQEYHSRDESIHLVCVGGKQVWDDRGSVLCTANCQTG